MSSSLRGRSRLAAVVCLWLCSQVAAAAGPVVTIRNNGSSANRVDLVVLGDGYTAAEIASGKYAADVETFLAGMFAQQPYLEYAAYFNVHRVDVASAQSGADHPLTGTYVDTAFDATYSCSGIQRLICVNSSKVSAVLTDSIPDANARDMILVLVNDAEYGGSGGWLAVASLNGAVIELVLHETGHSFGLLADEYGGPPPPSCNASSEPSAVNATKQTTRSLIKWSAWIDAATPVPTTGTALAVPGVYEGAVYCDAGLYRPTYLSKMRALYYGFDQINTEQIVKRIYNLVSPLDSFSPVSSSVTVATTQVFSVITPLPSAHSLVRTWTLDSVVVGSGNQYALDVTGMVDGSVHTLTVSVADSTGYVRTDPAGLLSESQTWTVTVSIPLAAPTVTTGSASTVGAASATLNGIVNPNGSATSAWFEWGLTTGYGNATPSQSLGSGAAPVAVTAAIGPLACGATYHFRLVGTNGAGPSLGLDAPFTAAACGGRIASDFTGDATSDILWRHGTRGDLWLWPMHEAAKQSETYVRTIADTNWEIRGVADFTGDGKADILWRHKTDGMIYLWPMNGAAPVAETCVAIVDPSYDIIGTGDFDGDGKADILWRNAAAGDVWIWLMNGAVPQSEVYVDTVDPGYLVKGVGDLNGDTKADLVWHGAAGDVWVWLMNGTVRTSQTYVGTVADTTYQIQQVADFDGNGRADILWWNTIHGDVWIWPMNGATVLSESFVGVVPDTNYRIVGAGDYNGDTKADILWRHVLHGDVWVWLMNGTLKVSENYIGTVADTGYQIIK